MDELVKIVIYVPTTHADAIRKVIGDAGAGAIGNYSHCTFSIKGIGRYKPLQGANPTIGEVGKFEQVEEERIETICEEKKLKEVIQAVKKVHPYEEPAFDIYPLINPKEVSNL